MIKNDRHSLKEISPTMVTNPANGMCYPCIASLHPRNAAAPQAPADEDEAAVPAGGLNYALYVLLRYVSNGIRML